MSREITFLAGTPIGRAAEQLVEAARADGHACGRFNDIELAAGPETTAEQIVSTFDAETRARAEAYRNSPEGRAAAALREAARREAQAQHDRLMRELHTLDWSSDVAVLDWLCGMQGPSDHAGVIVRRDTIVAYFERRGFKANENTGAAFKAGDKRNEFRYIVGQALAGLKEGPAIHGVLHHFVAKWKERFALSSGREARG